MKNLVCSLGLLAMTSVSHAVTTLGLDPVCNGNGSYQGAVPFNGGTYLRCDLPATIAVNDTVELAVNSSFGPAIVWALPGVVVVGNGNAQNANPSTVDKTVLQIEAGAHVAGAVNSNSALVISRGAQIVADGTEENPIIFSSLDDDFILTNYPEDPTGEWGGLVIAGFGESNDCPSAAGVDSCIMEGVADNFYYGGGAYLDTSMSSGVLRNVVVTEGGHVVAQDSEINGITFYAVNNTTTVLDIHVNENTDDGVEFFGGNVNVDNLWLTCNKDDSVDWDEGYRGKLTDVDIVQEDNVGHAFELASHPSNPSASPRANGSVERATLSYIGTSTPAAVPFRLKDGTNAIFGDIVVGSGYDTAICDNFAGVGPTVTYSDNIQYGCTAVSLPASGPATGATAGPSFWTAPNCN